MQSEWEVPQAGDPFTVHHDELRRDYIFYLVCKCTAVPFWSTWTGLKIPGYDNSCAIGVNELGMEKLEIFPNPASVQDRNRLPGDISDRKALVSTIYDLTGKLINKTNLSSDLSNITVEISDYPAGTYQFVVSNLHWSARASLIITN